MSVNAGPAAGDAVAVSGVVQSIVTAWADNDADAFAAAFTEDATLILPGDVFLKSRDQIRAFMSVAYEGPYKGTRVFGEPQALRLLGEDVILLITRGGVLAPGEEAVAAERAIRASWLMARQSEGWLITAYHNSPIGTN